LLDEEVNSHKPGATSHLLRTLPPRLETVMVIDPDVRICGRHEGSTVELEGLSLQTAGVGGGRQVPRRVAIRHGTGFWRGFRAVGVHPASWSAARSLADFGCHVGVSIYDANRSNKHSISTHCPYNEDLEECGDLC